MKVVLFASAMLGAVGEAIQLTTAIPQAGTASI